MESCHGGGVDGFSYHGGAITDGYGAGGMRGRIGMGKFGVGRGRVGGCRVSGSNGGRWRLMGIDAD